MKPMAKSLELQDQGREVGLTQVILVDTSVSILGTPVVRVRAAADIGGALDIRSCCIRAIIVITTRVTNAVIIYGAVDALVIVAAGTRHVRWELRPGSGSHHEMGYAARLVSIVLTKLAHLVCKEIVILFSLGIFGMEDEAKRSGGEKHTVRTGDR